VHVGSEFGDYETLRGNKLLHALFTVLSKKESSVNALLYVIEDYDVSVSAYKHPDIIIFYYAMCVYFLLLYIFAAGICVT
jgi:hypothetical protein